MTRDLICDSNG